MFAVASAGTSSGPTSPTSQIFAEKANVDSTSTPVHHLGAGALLLVGAVIVVGWLNHRANH